MEEVFQTFDELPLPLYNEQVQAEDLRQMLEEVVKLLLHIEGVEACSRAAKGLECLGRFEEAITKFQELKELATNWQDLAFATIERGIVLQEMMRSEEAKEELEQGIGMVASHQLDDYFQDVVVDEGKHFLGLALYSLQDYGRAVEFLEAGLNRESTLPTPALRYILGFSYLKLGMLDEAMGHLNACVEAAVAAANSPIAVEAYVQLSALFSMQSNHNKEIEMLNAAAELQDKLACVSSYRRRAGWLHFKLGEYKKGVLSMNLALNSALKIGDPIVQSRELHYSSLVVQDFMQLVTDTGEEQDTTEAEQLDFPLTYHKAQAMYNLGLISFVHGSIDEALEFFVQGMGLLSMADECDQSKHKMLLYKMKWGQAQIQFSKDANLALSNMQECITLALNPVLKVQSQVVQAQMLHQLDRWKEALSCFESIRCENAALMENRPSIKAQVLTGLGRGALGLGRTKESIQKLELARDIWQTRPSTSWKKGLNITCLSLFYAYLEEQQFVLAFAIAKNFEADFPGWQIVSSIAFNQVADNESAVRRLEKVLEYAESLNWNERYDATFMLANSYRNIGDIDTALEKYEEALQLLKARPHGPRSISAMHIYVNRGALFIKQVEMSLEQKEILSSKSLDEYQRAIDIFMQLKDVDQRDLARMHMGQAAALYYLNEFALSLLKVEEAEKLVGENDLSILAKLKYLRACILHDVGETTKAVEEAMAVALIHAGMQRSLQHLDSAWVTMLGGDMKHVNFLLQELFVSVGKYLEALLWAERGRMRLYFYLIKQMEQQQQRDHERYLDPVLFDKDDQLVTNCIEEALKNCDPGTAIVEFTYREEVNELYIYVVHMQADELQVDFQCVELESFFERSDRSAMGKTISSLISKTRTMIHRKDDSKAKQGLSILHELLVQSIQDKLDGSKTIIFAPHGKLARVPFAALYDQKEGKFLIEQKAVGIIPSIRALCHCFARQRRLGEQEAFVAGDPQPMGLGLPQLRGAAEEVKAVSGKLKVEPLMGSNVTKEVVIRGLTSSSIVVLVTHGIVNAVYPYGALVMQGQNGTMDPAAVFETIRSGVMVSRAGLAASRTAAEVLSAKEIEQMKIEAKLVVLSACQTGEGEISAEGVLGLGRAVLQAGAACSVLALWKVDDQTTKVLMTGVFRELVDGRQCILQSLRTSMLSLVHSGLAIYNWAPLFVFGSPTFSLVQ